MSPASSSRLTVGFAAKLGSGGALWRRRIRNHSTWKRCPPLNGSSRAHPIGSAGYRDFPQGFAIATRSFHQRGSRDATARPRHVLRGVNSPCRPSSIPVQNAWKESNLLHGRNTRFARQLWYRRYCRTAWSSSGGHGSGSKQVIWRPKIRSHLSATDDSSPTARPLIASPAQL